MLPEGAAAPGFPPAELANRDGLLAIGGDLAPQRLIEAYRNGIFPWFSEGQPILWWSPDPRMVLYPASLRISRSLRRTLRHGNLRVSADTAFRQTIEACSRGRPDGTWITSGMIEAYVRLHECGVAHSIETWDDEGLAGGLYGVAIGRAFFGESMFTRRAAGSKVALVALARHLAQRGFTLIDCQVRSAHLESMGAELVARTRFLAELSAAVHGGGSPGPWTLEEQACLFV